MNLIDKYKGAVLGAALGDGLGRITERKTRAKAEEIYKNGLRDNTQHVIEYTDDTEMAISILESLVHNSLINQEDIADRFIQEKSPLRGYSMQFEVLLDTCKNGQELMQKVRNKDRPSCGAAMRTYPIGLFYFDDKDKLTASAEAQAHITHHNEKAVEGAVYVSRAVAFALQNKTIQPNDFLESLTQGYDSPFAQDINSLNNSLDLDKMDFFKYINAENPFFGISVGAREVVLAALYCFLKSPEDYKKTIHTAITIGGDTDSVAAIAGAISGAHNGIQAIPSNLLERLEARSRLEKLAERLAEKKTL